MEQPFIDFSEERLDFNDNIVVLLLEDKKCPSVVQHRKTDARAPFQAAFDNGTLEGDAGTYQLTLDDLELMEACMFDVESWEEQG